MQEAWIRPPIPGRREWQPTSIFLPGEFHGQRSLVGYSLCLPSSLPYNLSLENLGIWAMAFPQHKFWWLHVYGIGEHVPNLLNFLQIGSWTQRLEKNWDSIHLVIWSFIRKHTISGFLMLEATVAQCPNLLNWRGLQNNDSLILSFHFHLLVERNLGSASPHLFCAYPVIRSYKKGRVHIWFLTNFQTMNRYPINLR